MSDEVGPFYLTRLYAFRCSSDTPLTIEVNFSDGKGDEFKLKLPASESVEFLRLLGKRLHACRDDIASRLEKYSEVSSTAVQGESSG